MGTDLPPETPAVHGEAAAHDSFAREVALAAFAADAFCLGPHWVYDTDRLQELYPDGLSGLDDPRSPYHEGKGKGDFTHYGDQTLVLLESLAKEGDWSAQAFRDDWVAFWKSGPESYLDGATRDTLDNWEEGKAKPSGSSDLAGASRMAPALAFAHGASAETAARLAREQTRVTHANPQVLDAAEFFARAAWAVREGHGYAEAFRKAAEEGAYATDMAGALAAAHAAQTQEPLEAALGFGQSCAVEKAFPLTLWMALRFEGSPTKMLEANALAGGDSSARGMLLAVLIAAGGRYDELPKEWTTGLAARDRIDQALTTLLGSGEAD